MNYIDFEAGGKVYKLRINTRNTVTLEKALGCNPLGIFGTGDKLPTITEMVNILYAAMQQYNHGITLNDTYDIFDTWLEEGNAATDFIKVIIDIYKASGIIKEVEAEKN